MAIVASMLLGKLGQRTEQPKIRPQIPTQTVKEIQPPKGDFNSFLNFIKGGVEGEYSDDTLDSGGETIQGTSQASWDNIRDKYDFLPEDVSDTTPEQRDKYTKLFYWDHLRASELPFAIAMQLVDFRFNGGQVVSHVIKHLQKKLGVTQTNEINPETVKAIWKIVGNDPHKQLQLARYIGNLRKYYYNSDLIDDNKKEKFGKGWYNRLVALDKFIVQNLFPGSLYAPLKSERK